MALSDMELQVFAYYVEHGAEQLDMVGRFWPYGELVLIIEDKVQLAVNKFGYKAQMASAKAARAFLDLMIENGGFSSAKSDLGGTMHQYQGPAYRACVQRLKETDPMILKAKTAGPDYWKDTFAALSKS